MNIDFLFKKKISIIIILLWPYLFLFPITFGLIAIGNDFDLIYFSFKRYIAEMLAGGVVPLWSPAEGTGLSLIFNPFAQFFYIPGWINYLIHFISKNLTLHNFVLYTISAISIFSLGIFYWLRTLNIDHLVAFMSALLIACSLKVTELIRFPNALHAAAWIPWVLYGINLMILNKKKNSILIIFFSNLFILTAGYPYFIVYSLFIFVPYTIFTPFIFDRKKNNYFKDNIYFYLNIFIPFGLSYLIALPWLLKVKEFLKSLVDRTENNWNFATEHVFYWKDSIGSWIFPPAASTEGWYYSGILVTIIVSFILTIFLINSKKLSFFDKKLILFSAIFILFITYFSWGRHSILFEWSWNNIPLIGSLRTWPRINIVVIPFVILLFAIGFKYLMTFIYENNNKYKKKIIIIFICVFAFLFFLQLVFYSLNFQNEEYWNFWQKKRFDAAIDVLPHFFGNILKLFNGEIYLFFNFLCLIFLIFIVKVKLNKNYIFILVTLIVSSELFVLSNLQWGLDKWKTNLDKTENPLERLRTAFMSPRIIDTVKGNEYFRDNRTFNVNYPDNYGYNSHARNFTQFFERYGGRKKINISDDDFNDVKLFYGSSEEGKKIFFSQKINHGNIPSFIKDSDFFEKKSNFKIEVLIDKFDGNKLELNVETKEDGWLSYIDNWDKGWSVFINGKKMKIEKLFGSYKSINIEKGFSKIKFEYKPW
tara:strand:+ start:1123 stop:3237 length:2115 start_codon:yes stop_codon:yes gene_type:complete